MLITKYMIFTLALTGMWIEMFVMDGIIIFKCCDNKYIGGHDLWIREPMDTIQWNNGLTTTTTRTNSTGNLIVHKITS